MDMEDKLLVARIKALWLAACDDDEGHHLCHDRGPVRVK